MDELADTHLLLGENATTYGAWASGSCAEGRIAWALGPGATPESPALAAKGDPQQPNEDALLVRQEGKRTLLAVADAHHGRAASHELLTRISRWEDLPGTPRDLQRHLQETLAHPGPEGDRSATSLVLAIHDARVGAIFGLSAGDSTCARLGPAARPRVVNARAAAYVRLGMAPSRSQRTLRPFDVDVRLGDLVLLFTDGIDACHYGHPLTSLGPAQWAEVHDAQDGDPAAVVDALCAWAYAGRDGFPGGEDNVAVVAFRAGAVAGPG